MLEMLQHLCSSDPALAFKAGQGKEKCKHCRFTGHPSGRCFIEHPGLAPDWFKEKMEDLAKKSTGKMLSEQGNSKPIWLWL